jgi:hypothetical protein
LSKFGGKGSAYSRKILDIEPSIRAQGPRGNFFKRRPVPRSKFVESVTYLCTSPDSTSTNVSSLQQDADMHQRIDQSIHIRRCNVELWTNHASVHSGLTQEQVMNMCPPRLSVSLWKWGIAMVKPSKSAVRFRA